MVTIIDEVILEPPEIGLLNTDEITAEDREWFEHNFPREPKLSWAYTGEFLKQFPANYHGAVGNEFCKRIREGHSTPRAVTAAVLHRFQMGRRMYGQIGELGKLLIAPGVMTSPDALEFAKFLLWREALPADERSRLKEEWEAENKEGFIKLAMAKQPPTPKQLAYLRSLNCSKTHKSKLEASELIELYTKGKKK